MKEYRCQWCRTLLAHAFAKCPNAGCDRPPGFKLDAHLPDGHRSMSRRYVLTDLGWETAGYVRDGAGWRKAP